MEKNNSQFKKQPNLTKKNVKRAINQYEVKRLKNLTFQISGLQGSKQQSKKESILSLISPNIRSKF